MRFSSLVSGFSSSLLALTLGVLPTSAQATPENNTKTSQNTNTNDQKIKIVLKPFTISQKAQNDPTKLDISRQQAVLESPELAKSLLNIEGFSMSRKGGGGSEISYRSSSGARLPVFVDNSQLHGGCGGRMDTEITYISPKNYKSVKIIKGPQDVRFGALVSGGVLFESEFLVLDKLAFGGNFDALVGSYGKFETSLNLFGGGEFGSVQATGGIYKSRDYKDANGQVVHSKNNKKVGSLVATLTPLDETALSFRADFGSGQAAYADRAMDGSKFDRTSFSTALRQGVGAHELNLQAFYHEIDHGMDNFSLRENKGVYNYNNPKRTLFGARAEMTLNFDALTAYVGAAYNTDTHRSRASGAQKSASAALNAVSNKPFVKNARFDYTSGFFQGEFVQEAYGIFGGARLDNVQTKQFSSQKKRTQNALSAFVRYENYISQSLTAFAGFGQAERVADFWEVQKVGGMELKSEKNAQLDAGVTYKNAISETSLNLFASKVSDFILLRYTGAVSAFNTDAFLAGGEISSEWLLGEFVRLGGGVSYTYGQNLKETNGLKKGDALPKIAPLAFRFLAGVEKKAWFLRAQVYANAAQHRYKEGYGNVVGTDLGRSDAFWTFGVSGGYKFEKYQILLSAENLNNALYSYQNSKNGVPIEMANYDIPATKRIYEPGRNFWIKIKAEF